MEAPLAVRKWYWLVVLFWAVTGLPIWIVGIAWGGASILTIQGLTGVFVPPVSSLAVFLDWVVGTILLFSPLIALPFAIRKRRPERPS